jgi:transposase
VVWDGAGYHRGALVVAAAERLKIKFEPLPGDSPDFMPVEALERWLREDVASNRCHHTADELRARVQEFEQRINQNPIALADCLWVNDELNPEEEKLRSSR